MKCDKCDSEATVHEVRIEGGKRREKHLCEQCAKSEGVAPQMPAPLTQLLQTFGIHQGTPAAQAPATPAQAAAASLACPECSTTYAQFRQTGLLGCPRCYEVFENQLGPLIARAHEGGTHHVGKTPKRPASRAGVLPGALGTTAIAAPPTRKKPDTHAEERAAHERIALLKKALTEAVQAEQYEKAAKIRDEIARLAGGAKPAAPSPNPAAPAKRKPRSSGEAPEQAGGTP